MSRLMLAPMLVLTVGCVSPMASRSHAKRWDGAQVDAAEVGVDDLPVRGHVVELRRKELIRGELVAAEGSLVWIEGHTQPYELGSDETVYVELDDESNAGPFAAWVALGTLSTLSHGILLVYSAPAWLLIGVPTAVQEGTGRYVHIKPDQRTYLREYARYPQGPMWGTRREINDP